MSKLAKTLLIAAIAVVCSSSTLSAQKLYSSDSGGDSNQRHHDYAVHHHGRHGVFYGHRYRGGYRPNYGHTYFNGHEIADVFRARAQANLLNAQARTQNEVARTARLNNDVHQLNTHIERRRINSTVRFAHLHVRGEQLRAAKADAASVAHVNGLDPNADRRLSPVELSPISGTLRWPLLLQTEHYADARTPVNQVFASRAQDGQINPDHYLPLRDWVAKVSEELEKHIHKYPESDYAHAQDFLRRLVIEASLPAARPMSSIQFVSK